MVGGDSLVTVHQLQRPIPGQSWRIRRVFESAAFQEQVLRQAAELRWGRLCLRGRSLNAIAATNTGIAIALMQILLDSD